MQINPHKTINLSHKDRLFFCGDVHGDKRSLDKQLKKSGFVEEQDTLIFAGDLIDRGKYNVEMIEYATCTPRVHSTIGNHELLFLYSVFDPLVRETYTSPKIGGAWIEQHSQDKLEELADLILSCMSIAITAKTDKNTFGVIHAKSPSRWQDVQNGNQADFEDWLWDGRQFISAKRGREHFVQGVDAVIHGHTPCYKTIGGNHVWIDTLYHTGTLTVINAEQVIEEINSSMLKLEQEKHLDKVTK